MTPHPSYHRATPCKAPESQLRASDPNETFPHCPAKAATWGGLTQPGSDGFAAALRMLAGLPQSDEDRAEAVRRLLKGTGAEPLAGNMRHHGQGWGGTASCNPQVSV